jgi:hypothetical protein
MEWITWLRDSSVHSLLRWYIVLTIFVVLL